MIRMPLLGNAIASAYAIASNWLRLRSARERWLILLTCSTVLIWMLWAGVFSPLGAWRDGMEREAAQWERRLQWIETKPRTQTQSRLRPGVLTASIGNCGLKLLRVNQEGTAILVTLQDQSFACVLEWLFTIEREHGIAVEQLRLQAGNRLGSVSGTLRFSE